MTTTSVGNTLPEATPPKCPHCSADMATVDGYPYTLGHFVILSVACTSCKKLLHMGIMPLAKVAELQREGSGIHLPS